MISAVEYTMEDAYNGGSCQLITGRVTPCGEVSRGVVR